MSRPKILGMTHNDAQHRAQHLLDSLVESGRELGCQVAAYHDGELVVDAWAGAATTEGTSVGADTLSRCSR